MSETAPLATVQKLLEECAVGHTIRQTTHALKITYNGKTYPTLSSYKNIELGYIRSMVRALEINKDCANRFIPKLFKIEKPPGNAAGNPATP